MKNTLLVTGLVVLLTSFAAYANPHESGLSPKEAYKLLVEGNSRFVSGKMTHVRQDADRRAALTGGQKPHTIILSCSDSRVPPELIFDQGLGDLFIVRVAGNIYGNASVASIEYAVEHLGSKLILVLGHDSCGAVKAAISTPIGESAGTQDLDTLISIIQGNIDPYSKDALKEDPTVRKPVIANADSVARTLVTRSKVIRKAVEEGSVKIIKGIYSLDKGAVEFWGTEGL